ncbi:hypothetical protein BN7_4504 [Wickerhamomyces ciferrii]|uniref:Uncharacterized protein n=1 Tax=Wickerhamomyces ciferrii (strain ATCC 14091 / BCRC 22168 / CBS 111 / JCM 3599 / NBRC 0793 / NRRL Y-1031 F-60-10) TaxID=1206466 RepID=K0KU41_WICCF|nr:uncharacterized protein BN7_4504 [Wickerhamomyces ciferrii]CCH44934.1 hypothetical protein BN7_4504 [Wickerhamomyces ciferrii]
MDAFIEATHLAVDIQLKVLQTLPSMFQIYGQFINGPLVSKLLLICSMLQSPGKTPMVVNTSAATQQQLVLSLLDKVVDEDKSDEVAKEFTVKIDEDEDLKIGSAAYDTYRLLNDLCALIERQPPKFLTFKFLPELFGYELLENVLSNYQNVFLNHVELGFILRTKITPLVLRSFSNHKEFPIVVRVSRIIFLLIKTQVSILEIETEVMLSLLTHSISKESTLPYWKKILSLEIFKEIFNDFKLVKFIFTSYDNHDDKKKVLYNFLDVCSEIIREPWATKILQVNDIVLVPTTEQAITIQNSSLRIQYLDLLDKNEAPPAPRPYTIYLILSCTNSFAEGIGNFVTEISTTDSNTYVFFNELTSEQQEHNIEAQQIKSLVTSNSRSIISIGTEFLYASLGNELFHSLIRALQKFCHASGVLGLNAEKNSLLTLFSIATISNNFTKDNNNNNSKSLTISETIVETLSHTIVSSPSSPSLTKIHQRYLNSRHIIIFRAFVSLVIALGPTLKKSWKFLLPTFQWFDYYINGPSSTFSFKEQPPKPDLTPADLKSTESLFIKLFESTVDYDNEAFTETLDEIIKIARFVVFNKIETTDPIVDDKITLCPYNRDYFIKKLAVISRVNATRLLEKQNKNWSSIAEVLTDTSTSSEIDPELRVVANATFNQSTKHLAAVAFSSDSQFDEIYIESELLNSLATVVDKLLSSLGEANISNSESEMIHDTLETLNELLDRFGTHLSHSWESVVHIINCPFKFFEVSKNLGSQKQLLKSAFEILQLLLNDFLQTVPLNILQSVINVLENFINQEYDLNVSFSAISYYWLMSDYFRQLMSNQSPSDNKDESSKIRDIWLYLLGSLVNSFNDSRSEVRNGAIQTFFRIVESHGTYLDWDITYDTVIKKLLEINFNKNTNGKTEIDPEYQNSISIVLKGLTELYSRFFLEVSSTVYWGGLISFFNRLLLLKSTNITFSVYKSFHQIVSSFKNIEDEIFEILFDFWSSQAITYVISDADKYQDAVEELISSFSFIYKPKRLSSNQIEKALTIFNSAIRFPFLPSFTKDITKPTKLQDVILDNLKLIDAADDFEILSLILSHISSITLLPFQTRTRILKKLQGKGKEVPSFIAISEKSIELLDKYISSITDFADMINNKLFAKVFKNLLEAVQSEIEDEDHNKNLDKYELWKKASIVLLELSSKVAPLLESSNEEDNAESKKEIWQLIINSIISTTPVANKNRDEKFNIEIYNKYKSKVLSYVDQSTIAPEVIEEFIRSLWQSSFLYEKDEIEKYLFETCDTPNQISEFILSKPFNDYSTESIKNLSQQSFRKICIEDLFKFSGISNDYFEEGSNALKKIFKISLPYLVSRLLLLLKRYSGSQKLLNNGPISSVQQEEQIITFTLLQQLISKIQNDERDDFKPLWNVFPYFLQNVSSLSRHKESEVLVRNITNDFYYKQSYNQ